MGVPTVQICSGGGVGLLASKFCLTVVHERRSKNRFDDRARLWTRRVGRVRWCCTQFIQMFGLFVRSVWRRSQHIQ